MLSDDELMKTVDLYKEHRTQQKCADILGISQSTVVQRLATARSRGYSPEHEMHNLVPLGFNVKGTSTLYDKTTGEAKIQWIKTDRSKEDADLALKAAIEAFTKDLPISEPVPAPEITNEKLLTVYPVGDHHFGCLSWGEETGGEDYNTEIAEKILCSAMQYLVDQAPPSEEAAILVLGDFLHFNNSKQQTVKGGHTLDSDSRFQKVVRAAIKAIRFQVKAALEKHKTVRLIIELGNHDADIMAVLMESFYAHYEDEPRVQPDRSPRNVHVFEWGKNLIGTHHGDKIKPAQIPLVIATDWPQMWGRTEFRVIHTGHVHHDSVKEHAGLTTETHRVLEPGDEYAASHHFRSRQTMKSIIYHKDFGEVARNTVTPQMLGEQNANEKKPV